MIVLDQVADTCLLQGIPTQAELLERAPTVAQNARQMAYIKPGSGGVLSLGLARLAASLKVHISPGSLFLIPLTDLDWYLHSLAQLETVIVSLHVSFMVTVRRLM